MSFIYLDYAAATPLDPRVLKAMRPYYSHKFYNPSATYLPAKEVRQAIENARSKIAKILGGRSTEIIFTAGGTEANNLSIHGLMRQYPNAKVLTSGLEHASVLSAVRQYNYQEIPLSSSGIINPLVLKNYIDSKTVLISVMYANNEIGTIQPIRQISSIIQQIRQQRRQAGNKLPLYFHSDATQAANYLDLHTSRLGLDLMTLNGSKIYGPKQTGLLWVRTGLVLKPLIQGGGQENNLRSGTESVANIIGLAEAMVINESIKTAEAARIKKLQKLFFELLAQQIPAATINGSIKRRLPNNVHLTIPNCDNERLILGLEESGILAAAGSACSASNQEPSYVLKSIGLSNQLAQSSVRFTTGRGTSSADIIKTIKILAQLIA